jgi:dUTP pyrophosphatase
MEGQRRSRYEGMLLFDQTNCTTLDFVTQSVEVLIQAAEVPGYSHPGDAGADLTSTEALTLAPGERRLVGTGVRIALPDGFAAFVVPRSGLAAKHGITIVNSPGTVDAGYRGEIKVALLNTDSAVPYDVGVGDRIAQLIVMPVARAVFIPVDTLPGSDRGAGGFGSTGYTSAPAADAPVDTESQGENA